MTEDLRARCAGLIVMGGRASRMGGVDKALTVIGGAPILAHALNRFAPQVETLALSANGDPARFSAYALPVLPDPAGGPEGPLGGVLAGLSWAASVGGVTHLVTMPGDAPLPPTDLVMRLLRAAGNGSAAAAHSARGVEPLHAIWPLALLGRIETLATGGVGSPRRMLEALGATAVTFDDPSAFIDIDEPADLARVEAALRTT